LSRRTASKGREPLALIAEYGGGSFDKLMAERADTIPPDSSLARNLYTSEKRRFRGGSAFWLVYE
jgi:hypothetical protein